MNWPATIANSLWVGSSLPALVRFNRALNRPAEVQLDLLRGLLTRNADCVYGKTHDFASIRSYEEFTRRVPLADYDDLEPWIDRIRRGESRVLTSEPVTHLIPTSGSTGARKLIPFTAGLQQDFNRAIGPWIADLARQHPGILPGPAYWSITPPAPSAEAETSTVPIGFADDASYLGGVKSRLVRAAMVAPNGTNCVTDMEEFRYQTLLCLLRERDLRLISVWHPSFLTLLLDALPCHWPRLLAAIYQCRTARARELEQADPCLPETLWPYLRVISCWGDSPAASGMAGLRRRFPNVALQPKGLLATEAFVTIPSAGRHPVAVRSHFFEFVDEHNRIHLLQELRTGERYEVVVTTSGGLWRYRLSDSVEVTGFVGATPSLRFLGRNGCISDLFGEKLCEPFVTRSLQEVMAVAPAPPGFVLLAPEQDAGGWHYTLYWEGEADRGLAERLDKMLRANPNYACCRTVGQLQAVRVFQIRAHGHETFLSREVAHGRPLGNVKPCWLSPRTDWAGFFMGNYAGSP